MGHEDDTPYCSKCGYRLTGLTDSAKCPECGRPIVEVLVRDSFGGRGYRYTSQATLFGLPLVSIAAGPKGRESYGRPRGIIAIGDAPRGVLAIGGRPVGVIAIGGLATGILACGGLSVGVVSLGGASIGILAIGGFAVGVWGLGGLAIVLLEGSGGAVRRLWPW